MGQSRQAAAIARAELMGVEFDCRTRSQAVDFADELRGGWILTANLHHIRTGARDDQARAYADRADLARYGTLSLKPIHNNLRIAQPGG